MTTLTMAKHLLCLIDTPDKAMGWRGLTAYDDGPFDNFKVAFAKVLPETGSGRKGALADMSQADRLVLKLALHEDIKNIFKSEEEAPKLLRADEQGESKLSVLEQIASIKVRIARLGEAKATLEAMVAKIEATLALPDKAFTSMPPPTDKERAEKRAKLQL